jgi:hypothetical protein
MPNQKPIYFCLDDRVTAYQIDLNTKLVYQLVENEEENTTKNKIHCIPDISSKNLHSLN